MPTEVEVLVVGAGPTGLTLAAQLAACGVRPRVVDRSLDRVHESRALAIQPRTLEVLAGLGISDELVAEGNRGAHLRMHARHRDVALPLFDLGLADTAYPYLLFLSQAETERVLQNHCRTAGLTVERGVELVDLDSRPDHAVATLRHQDGRMETVSARYVIGCDGAHSAVRRFAGIGFEGDSYPQTFVLADVEADGIEPGSAHVFLAERGILFFFPLGRPATWRLLAMRPPADRTQPDAPVVLDEVQAIADSYTGGAVRLRDPVWMTNFRLHHRAATRYRSGPVFLAGDAAHVHSPAGAQGMNTGIQDAYNLGWKLAHTVNGLADPALLDTYQIERAPVGATVLRFTDRAFSAATSTNPLVRFARTRLAPAAIPLVRKAGAARARAFRTVAQLDIRYRHSPLSTEGPNPPGKGPKAGDRLPDADVVHDGRSSRLHQVVSAPRWHLLLYGSREAWDPGILTRLREQHAGVLTMHHLTGRVPVQYLVRPDGHVGYRAGGTDLDGLLRYLERWLVGPRPGTATGTGPPG